MAAMEDLSRDCKGRQKTPACDRMVPCLPNLALIPIVVAAGLATSVAVGVGTLGYLYFSGDAFAQSGQWSEWSACTVSCGKHGIHTRSCTNPAPSKLGHQCHHATMKACANVDPHCPVDCEWSAWGSCSTTCGEGNQSRHAVNIARHGGRGCLGPSAIPCTTGYCPVDGGWSKWTACSKSCGKDGIHTRACTNPPPQYGGKACSGPIGKQERCNVKCCPVDATWSAWGECSKSCGNGSRTRICEPSTCGGKKNCATKKTSISNTSCNSQHCPVDGGWSKWTACSKACGNGTRTRTCTNPRPQYGGKSCSGRNNTWCIVKHCPVNGGWSKWSASPCHLHLHRRYCNHPPPAYGGRGCHPGATVKYCAHPDATI